MTWQRQFRALHTDVEIEVEGASLIEASRGEYPTISTTRRGDQVAVGTVESADLGIQMPTVTRRVRRRKS